MAEPYPDPDTLGKADWVWDHEWEFHMPVCSQPNGYGHRCGNGPLDGDMIQTGDCGEH